MRHELPRAISGGEVGHAMPIVGVLIGGVGAVLLGIGSANGTGALAVIGGIVLAAGLLAMSVMNHVAVEYGIFARLEKLEK